jgi:hypothetical protein
MKRETVTKSAAEFSRVLIGLTFMFSGIVKSIDPVGFAIKIGEYLSVFGMGSVEWLATFFAFNLSAVEFVLGVCLLLAVYRKFVTFCVLVFMSIMTPFTLYLAIFNPVADCGCFGDALIITNWETFFKNIILLAAAVTVFKYHRRLTSFFSPKAYLVVLLFVYISAIGFNALNFCHLPLIDFRPYKVGRNILKLMEIPPDAPRDEYRFIYEKDGVQKSFDLASAPSGDSTWLFIDAQLISAGFMPAVSSFELYDENDENMADQLLTRKDPVFLLIAPHLESASEANIESINNVYDYARENRYLFYGVTNAGEPEIAEWRRNTGALYPFLTADDVLLKTIIRSSPGLVLLKGGTILSKWHHNDIPSEQHLRAEIEVLLTKTPSEIAFWEKSKKNQTIYRVVLIFFIPLLLLWVYDFLRNRRPVKRVKRLTLK